jgi:hypothetical protein
VLGGESEGLGNCVGLCDGMYPKKFYFVANGMSRKKVIFVEGGQCRCVWETPIPMYVLNILSLLRLLPGPFFHNKSVY